MPAASESAPRGRLAPSPTGVLHLGNARSFLLAWLDARQAGGGLALRIEDLDGPRVRAGAAQAVLRDLRWLGLDWDGEPMVQSRRLPVYRRALEHLAQTGRAYPCICTRRDIEAAASAPHAGEEGPVYPGTCRGRFSSAAEARAAGGGVCSWRFQVPARARYAWQDRVAGPRAFQVDQELGDFVIWKKDDEPAYQLAVVVDDAAQGVTAVLRGDDLLPSTARQGLLQQALGLSAPTWAHVPLVLGRDGRRLAKRHGDTSLAGLRAGGATAGAILRWLAEVSGILPPTRLELAADLLPGFDLAALPREPVTWTGAVSFGLNEDDPAEGAGS